MSAEFRSNRMHASPHHSDGDQPSSRLKNNGLRSRQEGDCKTTAEKPAFCEPRGTCSELGEVDPLDQAKTRQDGAFQQAASGPQANRDARQQRKNRPIGRRSFLRAASAIGAAAALPASTLPLRSLRAANITGQVNLGIVGLGWRGGDLHKYFLQTPGVRVTGLCDTDQKLLDEMGKKSPRAHKWVDMRDMFDSPDIDAVVVATCNHWHCLAAIWAMQAGKHVYVEKPLGHTQWEGEQVVRAADKYGLICQVGTQQRSDPLQAEIKRFLHEDKAIGPVESVRVNRFGERKSIGRRSTPLTPPASLDYNLWLGPAADQPIYREKLHYDWHWDWNTGSGEMGNWGVHIIDDVRNNVFRDQVAAPSSITAAGGRFAWEDAGDTPNAHYAVLDAGGVPVVVALSNLPVNRKAAKIPGPPSGYIAYCAGGRLEGQRGKAQAFDTAGKLIREFKGNDGNVHHQKNFIDAIRTSEPSILAAPARVGNESTGWCNLINIASRVGRPESEPGVVSSRRIGSESSQSILEQIRKIVAASSPDGAAAPLQLGPTLQFDAAASQFVGDESEFANTLLRRKYRAPFVVPDLCAS